MNRELQWARPRQRRRPLLMLRAALSVSMCATSALEPTLAESPATATQPATEDSRAVLDAARLALRTGNAARAAILYETLAQRGESIEAELGLVQATMQAGEFRKAVAYANLTASEHPDSIEAATLLAFIGDRTGRTEQSLVALESLQRTHPHEWAPVAAHAAILIDRLAPQQALELIESWSANNGGAAPPALLWESARARLSMNAVSVDSPPGPEPVDASVIVPASHWLLLGRQRIVSAGNGVVIDAGRTVLTHAEALSASATEVLVRNGLGEVRRARALPHERDAQLVRLELADAFPAQWSIPLEHVGAPEGVRFCFALGFSVPRSREPVYPAMAPGLVFRPNVGLGGFMQITSALGAEHNGAPVFDARGQLIGLALGAGTHSIAGTDLRKLLGAGQFALRVDEPLTGRSRKPADRKPAGKQPPMPSVEELYERLAPAVVQVVALH